MPGPTSKKDEKPIEDRSSGQPQTTDELDCKVVLLTHYLPPYMGEVVQELSSRIRDLKVLLSIREEPNRNFGTSWPKLDVAIQKSWMLRRSWRHDTGFVDENYLHLPYDTLLRLRQEKPDLVFSFELGFRSMMSALYCRLFKTPLVLCVCVSEHTERGRATVRKHFRRRLLRQASAVSYNGPSCKEYLLSLGVPESKLFHFPYAASRESIYDGPIKRKPEDDHRLLYIGQLSQRKGVGHFLSGLVKYANQNPNRNLAITLVGDGALRSELEQTHTPHNLSLNFLGHLGYDEIVRCFGNHGVLVFPTFADEWGLVVNEAMHAGMPVLGSLYAQSSTTLIENESNGWLYDPASEESLFQQLDRVFACSRDQLNSMRELARATVQEITSPRVADQAVQLFRQLLCSQPTQS